MPRVRTRFPNVFVGHPFAGRFPVKKFRKIFKELPFKVIYGNTDLQTEHLLDVMRASVLKSDFSIFDLSDWNPNVALELGLAQGLKKKPGKTYYIVLNTRRSENVPSDIQGVQRLGDIAPAGPANAMKDAAMRKFTVTALTAAWLGLCCVSAFAQGDPNPKRRETLTSLYMARWTQTICGFRFNDGEKAKLSDAISFIEGRLTDTPVQKKALDVRAKASVVKIKTNRDCEADGRFDKIVRRMIVDLPDAEPPKSAPPVPQR